MKQNTLVRIITICMLLAMFLLIVGCNGAQTTGKVIGKCSLQIDCLTILDNIESMNLDKVELVPEDGIILAVNDIDIFEGDTVYTVFARVLKDKQIPQQSAELSAGVSYITSIANIGEMDCTEKGGWLYKVNYEFSTAACNQHIIEDGDIIEIRYSCDWGADIGMVFE